jgi:hypothetical protein
VGKKDNDDDDEEPSSPMPFKARLSKLLNKNAGLKGKIPRASGASNYKIR